MGKDSEEREADGDGGWEVTFRCGESIGGSSSFEEEQSQEYQDLGPYSSPLFERVDTESLESGKNDKHGSPTVVQREWEMYKQLIGNSFGVMMLLHNIVNVSYCGRDEEGENEGGDIAVMSPQIDVNSIKDTEERETPRNTVNDDMLSSREELVDNCT
jgi:hypothetical protein